MINTIRQINIGTSKYTKVFAVDEVEHNANHHYIVIDASEELDSTIGAATYATAHFQNGPVKEEGVNGCHNEDLIAIVIDRLQSFQSSEFACRENGIALRKLEEAMMWLNKRTADRQARGVEGTNKL